MQHSETLTAQGYNDIYNIYIIISYTKYAPGKGDNPHCGIIIIAKLSEPYPKQLINYLQKIPSTKVLFALSAIIIVLSVAFEIQDYFIISSQELNLWLNIYHITGDNNT